MRSRQKISFSSALLIAAALHLLAGAGLKYASLSAASPAPPPRPPLSLHFVEVPPSATSVAETPKTTYGSDANRKAGPVVPTPPSPRPPQPSAHPGPRSTAPQPAMASTPAMTHSYQPQSPAPIPNGEGRITADPPQLAQSLENLDRYIQKGTRGSGGGGGGDGGDLPTGDPGSGVYFDTQGYDLGPWGNRTVEIVRSNWIIPVAAELGMKGVVGISFKVDRMGNIRDLQIVSPSGVPSFDQAALGALQSSSPLPPLPADFPRDLLPGVFRFYYNTPVPSQ